MVRRTGGPVDTVTDAVNDSTQSTSFVFLPATAAGLTAAVKRAQACFMAGGTWKKMMRSAMARHFDWQRSTEKYLRIYALVRKHRA